MPRKVKVVKVNDDATYADITDTVIENEAAENETDETQPTEEVVEPEPQPVAKARATRVSKLKPLERTDTVVAVDTAMGPETATPVSGPKPKPKRAARVKVVERPAVVEEPVEKPKAVRKPRAKKEEPTQGLQIVVPPFPPRLSRTAAREALYHSLASGALS